MANYEGSDLRRQLVNDILLKHLILNNRNIFDRKTITNSFNEYFVNVSRWKYNIRRNANSEFSIVTMRRVAIIIFELGVVKNFMQKF